jgi:hypothetical protein
MKFDKGDRVIAATPNGREGGQVIECRYTIAEGWLQYKVKTASGTRWAWEYELQPA